MWLFEVSRSKWWMRACNHRCRVREPATLKRCALLLVVFAVIPADSVVAPAFPSVAIVYMPRCGRSSNLDRLAE